MLQVLNEKVGPLPVWAYGAAAFGAVLLLTLFRKQSAKQASSSTAMPTQPTVLTQIQPVLISPLPQAPVTRGPKPDMTASAGL